LSFGHYRGRISRGIVARKYQILPPQKMVDERYRLMTPERRMRIASSMFETARAIIESSCHRTNRAASVVIIFG
jgi:hypothetical protein